MADAGVESDAVTCCSLITALDKGGQWQLAEQVFMQMYADHPQFRVLLQCMEEGGDGASDHAAASTSGVGVGGPSSANLSPLAALLGRAAAASAASGGGGGGGGLWTPGLEGGQDGDVTHALALAARLLGGSLSLGEQQRASGGGGADAASELAHASVAAQQGLLSPGGEWPPHLARLYRCGLFASSPAFAAKEYDAARALALSRQAALVCVRYHASKQVHLGLPWRRGRRRGRAAACRQLGPRRHRCRRAGGSAGRAVPAGPQQRQ